MGSVGGERRESGRSYNRAPGVSWGGSVCLHHIRVNIRDVSLNSQASLSAGFLFVSKYKKKKKNPKINRIARSLPGMRRAAQEIESPDTRLPRRGRTRRASLCRLGSALRL